MSYSPLPSSSPSLYDFRWSTLSRRFFRLKPVSVVLKEASDDAASPHSSGSGGGLDKCLTLWDVVAYGLGSTIGGGIFVSSGNATLTAGPAIVLSFVFASLSCLLSAFSYSEFAARVPVSGSAYTFTYTCLGEIAAWFIGWNLTLEYAISSAAVAVAWSSNLQVLTVQAGHEIPGWMVNVPLGPTSVNMMASVICLVCTVILLFGVKNSSRFNMMIMVMNIAILLFIILFGASKVDSANWTAPVPAGVSVSSGCSHEGSWMPCGLNGVSSGAAMIFFSYIGFDSVTTLAEEVKNPKRDLPIGVIGTLAIASSLYIGSSLVVTGMVPWYNVDPNTPLATAFKDVGVDWATTLIAAVTVTGLTATTLTGLFGQPRIFYRMAKDGLLFSIFGTVHQVTKAPLWGTIITGIIAAAIALIFPLSTLTNMISIGTLLAFSTVCGGVVILRYQTVERQMSERDTVFAQREPVMLDQESGAVVPNGVSNGSGSDVRPLLGEKASGWGHLVEGVKGFSFKYPILRSSTFWLFFYLVPCLATCICLRVQSDIPLGVTLMFLALMIAVQFVVWFLPVDMESLPRPGQFVCPLVPFVPMWGIATNVYLITSLDYMSFIRVGVWTVLGMSIYIFYGVHHSRLTVGILKQEEQSEALRAEDALAKAKNDLRMGGDTGDEQRVEKVSPSINGNGNGSEHGEWK